MSFLPATARARGIFTLLLAVLLGVVIYIISVTRPGPESYHPQEGDIVFQSLPHSLLVDTIEGVTSSPYSHCGVVLQHDGKWFVAEAIEYVRETPLDEWLQRGRSSDFAVYRLKPEFQKDIPAFKRSVLSYRDIPYDIRFEMSDRAIYCSELVYKGFRQATGQSLGKLQPLRDLNWKPFESNIRTLQNGDLPLDRPMITPIAVSKADQLQLVQKSGL